MMRPLFIIRGGFHRYFQTGGEALRDLQERRKTVIKSGPPLANNSGDERVSYVLKFTK